MGVPAFERLRICVRRFARIVHLSALGDALRLDVVLRAEVGSLSGPPALLVCEWVLSRRSGRKKPVGLGNRLGDVDHLLPGLL
jgi:hypothetical protein